MPLDFVVDSLDTVPESLRANYKQDGDKFRLDLNGYEDPAGLKSALQKEREAAKTYGKEAAAWKALGKTPEEIQKLVEAQAKADEERLKGAGDFDALKKQMNEQHQKDIEKLNGKVTARTKAIERYLIDASAATALAQEKASVKLLMPHIRASVRVIEDGEDFVVRVVDAAGNHRVNSKGEFLQISDLVSEMRQSDEFAAAFPASGVTGGGAQSSAATGSKTIKQSAFNALPPKERAKRMNDGWAVVD